MSNVFRFLRKSDEIIIIHVQYLHAGADTVDIEKVETIVDETVGILAVPLAINLLGPGKMEE